MIYVKTDTDRRNERDQCNTSDSSIQTRYHIWGSAVKPRAGQCKIYDK